VQKTPGFRLCFILDASGPAPLTPGVIAHQPYVLRDQTDECGDDSHRRNPKPCAAKRAGGIRSAGLPRPGRHVALYLEGGSVEVGAEVSERFLGNDRVHYSQLPAGRVATTTHFGPYTRLGEAHSEIRRWCAKLGHRLSGVCWEIYGHWEESWNTDPSRIRTDVFHLLEDQKG
jgi:hypothetical protein